MRLIKLLYIESSCKCAEYTHSAMDWDTSKDENPDITLASNKALAKKVLGALKYL